MKKLYAILLITFFIVTLASLGFVSAQTTTISGTAQVFFDKTPSPGAFVTLTVNFQSASSSALQLYRIGIHTDWQEANQYYTLTFTDLEPVEANGFYSKSVSITIPANAEVRDHTLTVAIDGYTSDGDSFSWDSSPQTFPVAAFAPTVSPTSNQNNGNSSPGLNEIIIYAAVIAVVVVVVILVAVIFMKRKGRAPAPAASYSPEPVSTPPPNQAPPEQQPEDNGSDEKPEGKDFNI